MKQSGANQSYLSPAQKCILITASLMLLISLTCLALSSYHARDKCSVKVLDSNSIDCDDDSLQICDEAPAVKFEFLAATPNIAIFQRIRCSWRTRTAVLSIITACAAVLLSIMFLGLASRGSSRGWAVPIVILYILTLLLLITTIVLEGLDLTRGRSYASDYVRTAPGLITDQPNIIYSQVAYSRGSYIATIILFSVILVGLTALLISYLIDRQSAPKREHVPAAMTHTNVIRTAAPPSLQPVAAPMQKKVEVVDVRRVEQHLGVPAPHSQISAPYTTGGRQEGMVDISQEPAANRVNISA